jgi:hypothetical protein
MTTLRDQLDQMREAIGRAVERIRGADGWPQVLSACTDLEQALNPNNEEGS